MYNNPNTFTTSNRMLEQFLYMHRLKFIRQFKTEDGLNNWVFEKSPRFDEVFDEYKKLYIDAQGSDRRSRRSYSEPDITE